MSDDSGGAAGARLRAGGNFLWCGANKFFIKGVSYGAFPPNAGGEPFPEPAAAARDMALMNAAGFNVIRTYDVPPRWLLDLAHARHIRVLAGIPWPHHLATAGQRAGRESIVHMVSDGVRACARHPALLGYCVGNEIPAQIARWYGKRRTEELIRVLCDAARQIDPEGLVTYANFPSTEYLELPFLDFHCFNVYLHDPRSFRAYLARLQMLAGSRPVCLSEYGMDARQHGETAQAEFLTAQTLDTFRAGYCGAIAFSWTDDWQRGGERITDWAFGITDAERRPKPAYAKMQCTLPALPFADAGWPRISVVVAAYNAAATLADCLESLMAARYPDFEVIVVDDGSTDGTGALADQYACRDPRITVLHGPNQGLSEARNRGLARAGGDIVAYTDADCRVDADWLHYAALRLMHTDFVGVGGPNLVPTDDGLTAQAVGFAPGNPMHVMLSDEIAEHIPGCNMVFWKWVLDDIGGFQPVYRAAGDDVDVCWRLQARGYRIGFAPAALVWHHRRNSMRAYLKQQVGYGYAESLLEREHPEKFNSLGQVRWAGRIYASLPGVRRRAHIYQGVFGSAAFQSLYAPAESFWAYLPQTPEWYILLIALAALGAFYPLALVLPLAAIAWQIALCAGAASSAALSPDTAPAARQRLRAAIFAMHLLQPLARTWGRFRGGLGPFRWTRGGDGEPVTEDKQATPRATVRGFEMALWGDQNQDKDRFLHLLMGALFGQRCAVDANSGWEDWDLAVARGLSARAHVLAAAEYHGGPKVLMRIRVRLATARPALALVAALGLLGAVLYVQSFQSQTVDMLTDALGMVLPLGGLAWLLVERAQAAGRIERAVRSAARELGLLVLDTKGEPR